MSLEQKLQQIEELQGKINSYDKLPDNVLKKINYKFRLEWNYTSNSMEGNSLTKSETRSVMIGNITVNGKPIKDVLEVKGHDEVITTIMKMGKGELNISERRIKDIHTAIMHEEDPEKKALIGQWKKDNNYLYNYKNERFDFVAPADVPDKMHNLVNWVNSQRDKIAGKDKDALHPVILALKFNLIYISIHPFYDGNGRTSRILTNLILIAYGYPPLYIKENERSAYYQYLGDIQGYGGEPDVFFEYMAELIMRSQKIVLDAIEGRELEEPEDWEKKLLLIKAQTAEQEQIKIVRTDTAVQKVVLNSIVPLMNALVEKLTKFDELFANKRLVFFWGNSGRDIPNVDYIKDQAETSPKVFNSNMQFSYELNGFKRNGKNPFYCKASIFWDFNDYMYLTGVNTNDYNKRQKHFFDEYYSDIEISEFVNSCANTILEEIEAHLARNTQ